jgi:hypothetical protein
MFSKFAKTSYELVIILLFRSFDLWSLRNQKRPTQRALDWWESARFEALFVAWVDSDKIALSRPTHERVTQVVSQLV